MTYGITGNTSKEKLWKPVSALIEWLRSRHLHFCVDAEVVAGLEKRGLATGHACRNVPLEADIVLSFGGDGTLLNTAYKVGAHETPILGINIGRLGFLADIEVQDVYATIERLEAGKYRIEPRTVLQGQAGDGPIRHALNDFVLKRAGSAQMLTIDVTVDGQFLCTYWADGLIVSTSTGSTAYSLSVGGPIISPGAGVVVITPLAPHSLTVRPILVPNDSIIIARVKPSGQPYVFSGDGRSEVLPDDGRMIRVQRASHVVNLVKLREQNYFDTLRTKLRWGEG